MPDYSAEVSLRASTVADLAFGLHVTESSMKIYAEQTWGAWNREADFDPASDEIIIFERREIGVFCVEKAPGHWKLDKFYILPAF